MTKKNEEKATAKNNAIALQYNPGEVPFVCAAGSHEVAQAILSAAESLEIPIFENEELLTNLAKLETGQHIPKELYLIVAQILAFVYHIKGMHPNTA